MISVLIFYYACNGWCWIYCGKKKNLCYVTSEKIISPATEMLFYVLFFWWGTISCRFNDRPFKKRLVKQMVFWLKASLRVFTCRVFLVSRNKAENKPAVWLGTQRRPMAAPRRGGGGGGGGRRGPRTYHPRAGKQITLSGGDEQASSLAHDITSLAKQEETRASRSHMRPIISRWSRVVGAGGRRWVGGRGTFSTISPLAPGSYWG